MITETATTGKIEWTIEKFPARSTPPDPDVAAAKGFGVEPTDRMLTLTWTEREGWHDGRIGPYRDIRLPPMAVVFHYGQAIFEGQKAYRHPDGEVALFRPDMNARRFRMSARRMCMAELDEEIYVEAIERLVDLEREWVPAAEGCSLYIRPTMIATEPFLGVRPARRYLFFLVLSPSGLYFRTDDACRVLVERQASRAIEGGTGAAKAGGNYAAGLMYDRRARSRGFHQVLWLDAAEHRYVEEMGAMNACFVERGRIVTAPLRGTILPGVTRDSLLELAPTLGIEVEERLIDIDDALAGIERGAVTEAFAVGTAAVVTPFGIIGDGDREYVVGDGKPGPVARRIRKALTDIQWGRAEDAFGWVHIVRRFA